MPSNLKRLPAPMLFLVWCLYFLGKVISFPFLSLFKLSFYIAKKIVLTGKRKSGLIPSPLRFTVILSFALGLFFFYSVFLINLAHDLPSPTKLSDPIGPVTSQIYDREGRLLYRFYENKNRLLIKLDELPPYLIQATIAIEDKNFYNHSGVDFYGIVRAVTTYLQDWQTGKEATPLQGGSTLTQQLIKNTLLTPERSLERKVKEIVLSFWAERIFSKDEILQMYFNEAPFGGPFWGVEAASQSYFGKSVKNLNLGQAAYLAGLPASPTTYSPYSRDPRLGKKRQKEVLRRMVEDGYINQAQADEAEKEELAIKPPSQDIKAPHFVMYVKQVLAQKYGERLVSQGGLKVITSLDLKIQEMAEQVVVEEVEKIKNLKVTNGAAMVVDPRSGQILAMVGSKDYWDKDGGNFNVATSLRQPGSAIKPITYATAFKMGYFPGDIILDAPVVYRDGHQVYAPVNYDGRFHGSLTLRTALASSYNVPAVKLLNRVGIENMLKTAQDLGITSFNDKDRYGLSLTLGGGEVRLLDMMSVYASFSQLGVRHQIQPILKITDSLGNVVEDNQEVVGEQVILPGIAYLITDILADNKARTGAFGPNSLLNIPGHSVAVKTGTTDNKRDNWTFGYTPDLVVGVWVGNNNNEPMNPQLTSGITGASPIWNKIMVNLLKDKPNLAFKKPAEVVEGMVNGHKDLVVVGISRQNISKNNPTKRPFDKESISFTDPVILPQNPLPQPAAGP